jgi:uncharacterized protein (TIGR02757 family)
MSESDTIDYQRLRDRLDYLAVRFNCLDFIELDPISVPHCFSKKQDIEIAGFFSAILAWGNRKTIITKAREIITLMDDQPYDFIVHHSEAERKKMIGFKHRTFQSTDLLFLIEFLQIYYRSNESLEQAFYSQESEPYNQKNALTQFYDLVFNNEFAPARTKKHIASPHKNSACKRLNMFLRWMVRKDDQKVDFGLWDSIPMSGLMIPLDVHVDKYARNFGLLTRRSLDWIAVEEITSHLRMMRPSDPVYYDYALFGLGVHKDEF